MVPKAHCVAALIGCHQDTGHQRHDRTLSLLQEHFWWPGMTNQVQKSMKSCMHCIQHEGSLSKAPLHPIVSTAPMGLLHIDFTNIETTMELNRPPKVTNVLVFQDHFLKHIMVYVTPDQTTETFAKFLYQVYISISWTPARLLSDHSVNNFMSNIIREICKPLSVKKLWTPDEGLVERSHQTIMQMTGKLGGYQKADWPGHLAEIVHAFNATWSAVMGYSPHYLMFGCRPRLPLNFYFPTLRSAAVPRWGASTQHVDEYIATV